ncbi:hypothetical protein VTK73DRAFT_3373 [Phialemonium thermophilum]|uniref:Uncharacterized protein n=1 Tax=Phialemonium thermophilum TaxID=223376 RepID=A0ABR3WZM7_9PEZI
MRASLTPDGYSLPSSRVGVGLMEVPPACDVAVAVWPRGFSASLTAPSSSSSAAAAAAFSLSMSLAPSIGPSRVALSKVSFSCSEMLTVLGATVGAWDSASPTAVVGLGSNILGEREKGTSCVSVCVRELNICSVRLQVEVQDVGEPGDQRRMRRRAGSDVVLLVWTRGGGKLTRSRSRYVIPQKGSRKKKGAQIE